MKKIRESLQIPVLVAAMAIIAALFLGCEELAEEDSSFDEPGAGALDDVSNPNATIVEDADAAETLLVGMVEEIYDYIESASPVGNVSVPLTASETESDSYSDSWSDDTYEGPNGGTFVDSGSVSESYELTYPGEEDTLPAAVSIEADTEFSTSGEFDDYQWYSYTGGGYYVLNGEHEISAEGNLDGSGTVRAVDSYGNVTDATGTITARLSAEMYFAYTAEPASGSGDAVRVIAFVDASDSMQMSFDEDDTSTDIDVISDNIGQEALSQVTITGTIKVYDEDDEVVDEKQLDSSTIDLFIELTDIID